MALVDPNKMWFSRKETARYMESIGYPVYPNTLAKWANIGRGPVYYRNGWKDVQYLKADIDLWVSENRVRIDPVSNRRN